MSARAASSRATATPQKLPPLPPPSPPSKLPAGGQGQEQSGSRSTPGKAKAGQGGEGQEQSGSRSTPGKSKTAPTMAHTHTHTAYCMKTPCRLAAESLLANSYLEYAKIVVDEYTCKGEQEVLYLHKYTSKGEQHFSSAASSSAAAGFSSFFIGDVINQVDPAGPAAERAAKACSAGEGEAAAAGG